MRAAQGGGVRLDTPWSELSDAERDFVVEGDGAGYAGVRGFFALPRAQEVQDARPGVPEPLPRGT